MKAGVSDTGKFREQLQSAIVEIDRELASTSPSERFLLAKLREEKRRLSHQIKELDAQCGREKEGRGMVQMPQSSFLQDSAYKNIMSFRPGFSTEEPLAGDENPGTDPVDERVSIETLIEEMGLSATIDKRGKDILLHGADIFIDNLITSACAVARNRSGEEVTKDDVLFSLWMERRIGMYCKTWAPKKRDLDKEHLKRMQMIKKDGRKGR
jgi:Transcription initiation factor TFIID subunit A